MQHSDDALDFLESLIIFNHICPFAVEHLPVMSRRVFDVGLDMGRMRNSLRPSKDGKRSKSKSAPDRQANVDPDGGSPQQTAMIPRIKQKKSQPNMRENLERRHPDNTVILPTTSGGNYNFPQPPKSRNSNSATQERSLHSSQLNPPPDTPSPVQKPDNVRRSSDQQNYDLKPPPPNTKVKHVDTLSEQLFSGDHLRIILDDPSFFLRFTAFINRFKPNLAPVLVRYLEAQKATKAVEYANALSATIKPMPGEHDSPCQAASVDPRFEQRAKRSFETLTSEGLSAYVTNCLTKVVTEYMVREITGSGMPVMRELVGGLAEVFCLADPSMKDNPIVYASEEFYRTTRYSRDDVLGRNCRFLQGPKTNRPTVERMAAKIRSGEECCETVLNYRRDGSPFMNLLLIAPLYDNRGIVRYFIGAQIDVSGLIEDGRGLDTFERLLSESRLSKNRESELSDDGPSQKHLKKLNELGQMMSQDEASMFQRHSRNSSFNDTTSNANGSVRNSQRRRDQSLRRPRRVLGDDDRDENGDKIADTLSSLSSGRLPGVYQNVRTPFSLIFSIPPPFPPIPPLQERPLTCCTQYLLVRPHPSLRIIFVSPALRIPGLLQSPLLPHIGGPEHVRSGLAEAFEQGAAVTAKVTWIPTSATQPSPYHNSSDYTTDDNSTRSAGSSTRDQRSVNGGSGDREPRTRYISCTPLLGSDDQVGVWMVVMVENELVTGSLPSRERALARYYGMSNGQNNNAHLPSNSDNIIPSIPPTPSEYQREIPQEEEGNFAANDDMRRTGTVRSERRGKVGSEGGRLYAEFMRGEGYANGDGDGEGDGVQGKSDPLVDGFADGGRVQEVLTPGEERGNAI